MRRVVILACIFLVVALSFAPPTRAQMQSRPPLSYPGPHRVGYRDMTFLDETRDDRALQVFIYYPSAAGGGPLQAKLDVEPDPSAAPYPLILYSHGWSLDAAMSFGLPQHLASYGYITVSISHMDPDREKYPVEAAMQMIHRPLDVLFVLEQIAALPADDPLAALVDPTTVGVTGYSAGGTTSLMFNGARVDPSGQEAEVNAFRATFGDVEEGELWPAYSDPRIRAVAPLAPGHHLLFGEEGLAEATLPTLIMAGTLDENMVPSAFMNEHMTMPDNYFISLYGIDHMVVFQGGPVLALYNHFVTAFFGYFLKGEESYADYLTPEGVNAIEGAAWGVVEAP